jgi:hypothetical protein
MRFGIGDIVCDTSVAQPPTAANCWDTSTGAAPGAATTSDIVSSTVYTTPTGGTSYQLPSYNNAPTTATSWISNNSTLLVGLGALVGILAFMSGRR